MEASLRFSQETLKIGPVSVQSRHSDNFVLQTDSFGSITNDQCKTQDKVQPLFSPSWTTACKGLAENHKNGNSSKPVKVAGKKRFLFLNQTLSDLCFLAWSKYSPVDQTLKVSANFNGNFTRFCSKGEFACLFHHLLTDFMAKNNSQWVPRPPFCYVHMFFNLKIPIFPCFIQGFPKAIENSDYSRATYSLRIAFYRCPLDAITPVFFKFKQNCPVGSSNFVCNYSP